MAAKDPNPPYFSILTRWFFVAALVFSGVFFGVLLVADQALPKTYQASAMAEVQFPTTNISAPKLGTPDEQTLEDEVDFIKSSPVMLPVIQDLQLEKAWAARIFHSTDPISDDNALLHLQGKVAVAWVKDTSILRVTVSSDVPPEAAEIANGVIDQYLAQRNQQGPAGTNMTVRIVERADAPTQPAWPNSTVVRIVAALLGAMLAISIASFMEVAVMLTRASERH